MSEENVEIVRRLFGAWEGGDLAGVLADLDPEMVTNRVHPAPDPATYNGPEGLLQAGIDWFEGFDEMVMTGEEYIDAGRGQVIARVHQAAHGEHSGVPVEADFWFVWTLHNAKITGLDMYMSKAQALEAAGLRA
jgi:ketosteroid isomerase-like protein